MLNNVNFTITLKDQQKQLDAELNERGYYQCTFAFKNLSLLLQTHKNENMAKVKNTEYKQRNEEFMNALRNGEEELFEISQGVLVKIIKSGDGERSPRAGNVVTVHYKGSLINGKVFDSSYERGYPEAFRLSDLIVGWQIALTQMHTGDHWIVYIPYDKGYGTRTNGPIPAYSTLIFEMELIAIM